MLESLYSKFIAIVLVGCYVILSNAFNLDVVNYIKQENGSKDSMFGFSVALHREAQKSWVIIGAPNYNIPNIPGVKNSGAVFKCEISDDDRCSLVAFDQHDKLYNGNQYNEKREQVDSKSYQWFGATVASAGVDGPLVACAPRYIFHTVTPRKVERNEPVGTCYIARNNFNNFSEYSPCRTIYWGYHRQGSCQAGFSAAVSKDGDRVFIGAPGSWYWGGQVYSINTEAEFPYKPPRYGRFGEGQIYSHSLSDTRNKVYSTSENSAQEDDSYMGYSSATGDFTGDGKQGVAVGMPRGGQLLGKVLLYTMEMVNLKNITGEQIGAYFGYSMCTVDVDGDKLDDLIIGAPMYTEPNNEGKYDTGRVYIIFQGKTNKFEEVETRDGITSKARFGLSVASLGDINLDGYGDFAVGAPYDGPNGRGAIYIYHGSQKGPLPKASQTIFAEDVIGTPVSTFGFAISGGIDLDGNLYPDIVVGAYDSNYAIVFRSRPVAVMEAKTVFLADNKLISLDDKRCVVGRDKKSVTCTKISSCLKYTGTNLPKIVDFEIIWTLDSKKTRNPRMFFVNDESHNVRIQTMRLERGKTECVTHQAFIIDNIRDKLTPLEVEMKYSIRSTSSQSVRVKRAVLEPILDLNLGTVQKDSINIQKNCGVDNICIPDLRLEVKTVDKFLLGSKDLLMMEILISNFGEDAFESGFYMAIPTGLNFKRIEKIGDIRDTPITCTAPSLATNNTLKCDIGNPLSSGRVANFRVVLSPSNKFGMTSSYDFYMVANSTNAEEEGSSFDNIYRKSIEIWVETDLVISGKSEPSEIIYNASQYESVENAKKEQDLGPQVVHIYNIRNNGPSTIEEAEIFILWPYETNAEEPLMYLMQQPESSGNIKCSPTIYVNQRDLELDSVLKTKSYLEIAGVNINKGFHSMGYHGSGIRTSSTGSVSSSVSGGSSSSSSSSSFSSSSSSSASASGSRGQSSNVAGSRVMTEEERRRLDAEQSLESTGDGSFDHINRAAQASGLNSGSSSRGSFESGRGVSGGSAGSSSSSVSSSSRGSGSQGSFGAGGSGGSENSYYYFQNSSSTNGQPGYSYSASRNRSATRLEDGRVQVSEASTEKYDLHLAGQRSGSYQGNANRASSTNEQRFNSGSSSGSQYGGGASINQHEYGSASSGSSGGRNEFSSSSSSSSQQQSGASSSGRQQYASGSGSRVSGSERIDANRDRAEGSNVNYASNSFIRGGATRYQQNGSYGNSAGIYKNDDYDTSDVHQDISKLSSRTHGQMASQNINLSSSQHGSSAAAAGASASSSSSSSSSGRRRMMSQQDGEEARPELVGSLTPMEKIAQGTGGFHTSSFDLGVLGNENTNEDSRRQGSAQSSQSQNSNSGYQYESRSGSSSGGAGGSQSRTQSSYDATVGGSRQGSSQGGSQGSSSRGSSATHYSSSGSYNGDAGGSYGSQDSRRQGQGGSGYSYSSSSGGANYDSSRYGDKEYSVHTGNTDDDYTFSEIDNIEDEVSNHRINDRTSASHQSSQSSRHSTQGRQYDSVDNQFKHYQRLRRDADDDGENEILSRALHCSATRCAVLRCIAGPIVNEKEAFIALRTRMVASTLNKIASSVPVNISTMAVARVTKLPHIGMPKEKPIKSYEIPFTLTPEPTIKPDVVPLWVVVVSACAGAIILLLLIYLLYKCGFFKRNRPSGSSSERQPLNNRNGYHGDEHL